MQQSKKAGQKSNRAEPSAQSKSKSKSASARAGAPAREPDAIVVTNFADWNDDAAELTPDEYQALKAFASQRGLSMAASVKLDAVRSASIAGFQAGAGPGAVTIELQHEDGRAWCQFDLPAETFAKLKRATAALGIDIPAFILQAATEFGHETTGAESESGAAPQRGPAAAAPDRSSLEMLGRRLAVGSKDLPVSLDLNLPGLALADWNIGELLHWLSASIHFGEAGSLIRELVLRRCGSAWASVELAEVLSIAGELHDGNHDKAKDEHGLRRFDLNEWCGVSAGRKFGDADLLMHISFVVSWHTEVICRDVLPRMSRLVDAAQLAEGLVIAETVVNTVEKKAGRGADAGTVVQPTMLERQAWELAARLWLEWPEDRGFGDLIGDSNRGAELVGLASSGKGKEAQP